MSVYFYDKCAIWNFFCAIIHRNNIMVEIRLTKMLYVWMKIHTKNIHTKDFFS